MKGRVSRREFLRVMQAMLGAGLVSACTPAESPLTAGLTKTPTSIPTPTAGPTETPTSTATPTASRTPTPSPTPSATPMPTPLPVPVPEPVSTNFDVLAHYLHGRGISEGDPRTGYGYATVVPVYGEQQDRLKMMMDIKWAREHGITTFVMPAAYPDTTWERRLDEMFLAANRPPFEIDYAIQFNPGPYLPWETSHYTFETGVVKVVKDLLSRHVKHPRYKRLPDGRPVVFYYYAHMVRLLYWPGRFREYRGAVTQQSG